MVTILISAAFRGAALISGEARIRGRRLFLCGYPKVRRLLEGEIRKYGKLIDEKQYYYVKKNSCEELLVLIVIRLLKSLKF